MNQEHDPAVPIKHGKWEIVAQRLAMGDNRADAYRKAGYSATQPSIDVSKLLKKHPEILERAEYLKTRMFDRQVDTKLITRDEVLQGLMHTIKQAMEQGKPQLSVVHSCYRTIAEMEGMLIKKSEVKRMKEDPFEDASRQQLVNMIERATRDLGLEIDGQLLDQFLDSSTQDSGQSAGVNADEEASFLSSVSETSGIPQ